jgi:8-oxo-dGTP pyrophosphatase MutT (NUDIX family)
VASAWFVPWGGVESGETVRQAAVREIEEETGVSLSAEDLVHLAFAEGDGQVGEVHGWMRDDVFVSQVQSRTVNTRGLEQHEHDAFHGYRWWLVEELQVIDEPIFPNQLASTLVDYFASSSWPQPVQLPL